VVFFLLGRVFSSFARAFYVLTKKFIIVTLQINNTFVENSFMSIELLLPFQTMLENSSLCHQEYKKLSLWTKIGALIHYRMTGVFKGPENKARLLFAEMTKKLEAEPNDEAKKSILKKYEAIVGYVRSSYFVTNNESASLFVTK